MRPRKAVTPTSRSEPQTSPASPSGRDGPPPKAHPTRSTDLAGTPEAGEGRVGAALKPRPARVWWLAARPATLAASVSPVLAGTAIAVHDHHVRTLPGLGALVVAVAREAGVHYATDYSDDERRPQRRHGAPPRCLARASRPPGPLS